MTNLSPSYDNKIARKYSIKTLDQKKHNKTALQEELGWSKDTETPVLCVPTGLTKELNGELFAEVLPGILSLNVAVLILGKGETEFGEMVSKIASDDAHHVHIMKDTDADKRKMFAAADMALFLKDPADGEELHNALHYGVVPVAPEGESISDYNPIEENGNAFVIEQENMWHVFAAIVRALETHRFPYDWKTIQKACMEAAKG